MRVLAIANRVNQKSDNRVVPVVSFGVLIGSFGLAHNLTRVSLVMVALKIVIEIQRAIDRKP